MQNDDKVNILLVDDKLENLIALEAVLGSVQYNLLKAGSGVEALALLETHDVALVLLDVQMPGMDGFETASRIKGNERTKNIPIIFVTAIYKEDPFVQRGYQAGAVDYFPKPFDPAVLQLKVGIYANLYQKNATLRRQEEEQKKTEAQLRAAMERYEAEVSAIFESVPTAICVSGKDGHMRCNAPVWTTFGLDPQEGSQLDVQEFIRKLELRDPATGKPVSPADHVLSHALRGKAMVARYLTRNQKTGEERLIESRGRPVRVKEQVIGAVSVSADVTYSEKIKQPG